MNIKTALQILAVEYRIFKLFKDVGSPVHLSQAEVNQYFESIEREWYFKYRFALAVDLRNRDAFMFEYNLENFLDFHGKFNLSKYLKLIHPDYILEYLRWAEAMYVYSGSLSIIVPMKQSYRIIIPMRLKNGHYHWVTQESWALQMDAESRVVSHLNVYTVNRVFNSKEKLPLVGEIWDEHFELDEITKGLRRKVFMFNPFVLTPQTTKIIQLLRKDPDLSNTQLAEHLGISKNAVDFHNKRILEKARASFKGQYFLSVRELILFLENLNFLSDLTDEDRLEW